MAHRRTDLQASLLDALDFVEEQIEQALTDPELQLAAVDAANVMTRCMTARLRSDDPQKHTSSRGDREGKVHNLEAQNFRRSRNGCTYGGLSGR